MRKMINVAICDDDIATTGILESMIHEICKVNFISVETEVFWDGKKLVESVEAPIYYDIIFLDIEMEKENGISAARRIRTIDKNVLIIYVTSHDSYMMESFSVRPFRYLLKPVDMKNIENCFLAAYEEIISSDNYFRCCFHRINYKILIRDIIYFESRRRKIYVITEKETFELYGKLNEIEKRLKTSKSTFLRIHQSFLVNYKHVDALANNYVVMDNGKWISISEERRNSISQQYCALEDTIYVGK